MSIRGKLKKGLSKLKRTRLAELKLEKSKEGKTEPVFKEVKKLPPVFLPSEKDLKKAAERAGLKWEKGKLMGKYSGEVTKKEYERFMGYLREEVTRGKKEKDLKELSEEIGYLTSEDYRKAGVEAEGEDLFWLMALDVMISSEPVATADKIRKEKEALQRMAKEEGLTPKQALKMLKEFKRKQRRDKAKSKSN